MLEIYSDSIIFFFLHQHKCIQLEASNTTLAQETSDLERIANVVRSKRHFDLISEREIKDAQDHLSVEILPQLKELILRAEDALQKDDRRAKMLRGKVSEKGGICFDSKGRTSFLKSNPVFFLLVPLFSLFNNRQNWINYLNCTMFL